MMKIESSLPPTQVLTQPEVAGRAGNGLAIELCSDRAGFEQAYDRGSCRDVIPEPLLLNQSMGVTSGCVAVTRKSRRMCG